MPTPPLAPVTTIGPSSGRIPCRSRACTLIAAVNPAVPMAAASDVDRPSANGTTHSAGTRANSAYPPWRPVPISYPWTTTRVPTATSAESDSTTVPARSMPGTIG